MCKKEERPTTAKSEPGVAGGGRDQFDEPWGRNGTDVGENYDAFYP
jgi:hypothetical protein